MSHHDRPHHDSSFLSRRAPRGPVRSALPIPEAPPVPPAPGWRGFERARRFTVEHRRNVLAGFFSRRPGDGRASRGLGRALEDFQDWEIRSGRLVDGAGSRWWSTVNGILVGDLADAQDGAAGPWAEYRTAPPRERQARLWLAHQDSINRGVAAAEDLLVRESHPERAFIALALGVVEMAAAVDFDTSNGSLGRRTAEIYPRCYPCGEADLEHLREELAAELPAFTLPLDDRHPGSNVG